MILAGGVARSGQWGVLLVFRDLLGRGAARRWLARERRSTFDISTRIMLRFGRADPFIGVSMYLLND